MVLHCYCRWDHTNGKPSLFLDSEPLFLTYLVQCAGLRLLKPERHVLFLLSRNRHRLTFPNTRCIQHGMFLFSRVIREASIVGFSSLTALQMFQIPWLLIMSIAAAWMYRSLQDFSSSDMYDTYLFLSPLNSLCVVEVVVLRLHTKPRRTLSSQPRPQGLRVLPQCQFSSTGSMWSYTPPTRRLSHPGRAIIA